MSIFLFGKVDWMSLSTYELNESAVVWKSSSSLRVELLICWISLYALEKLENVQILQPTYPCDLRTISKSLKIAPYAIWIKDIVWHYRKFLQVSWNCQGTALDKTDCSAKDKVHELCSHADQGFVTVNCQKILAASVLPAEYWLNNF